MLYVDESLIIGKGAHRVVYTHPLDQNKCIKINIVEGDRTQHLETAYLKTLESTGIFWKHLSRFYGEIETNIGKGYVFELIRDFDQAISLELSNYLNIVPTTYIKLETILEALAELRNFLVNNKVLVKNLRPYNMVFKRMTSSDGHIVIIDNIGHHNNNFHLSDYVSYLARKDIQKKWKNLN